jgi:hypothetical protein
MEDESFILCLIPLSTSRFFVSLAFSKPKNELPRSLFFCQENVQAACKMLSVTIGGRGVFSIQSQYSVFSIQYSVFSLSIQYSVSVFSIQSQYLVFSIQSQYSIHIPNSQLPTPNSQLPTLNSQLPTPNSQLPSSNICKFII